jgi:hypothetical protein
MIPPTHPMQLALGLIIWSAFFVALYGGLSVGCALAPPDNVHGPVTWINGALLALTVMTTLVLLSWSWKCWRAWRDAEESQSNRRYLSGLGTAVHLIAAGATVAVAAPLLVLPPCI